jgi:tape measure domain-containing protein
MATQDADLKLRVGLDLAFFRQQLSGLGQAAAGYNLPINIRFDRRAVQTELNALSENIRRRKYTLEVNTNLSAEIEKANKLVQALQRVQSATSSAKGGLPIGTTGLGITKRAGQPSAAEIKALFNAAMQGGLLDAGTIAKTRAQMVAALGGIGRDSIEGLLNGLSSGNARLRAAAESLGDDLIAALKTALGIASPSKETGKLGKFAAEGFEKGFVSGMVKAERTMAMAIRSAVIGAIREGLSNLPGMGGALVGFERQLAASVQLAIRKAMREGLSASVLPGAKGTLLGGAGGAATGATIGGAKALGGGIAGGVAKLTAGGLMGTAANLARYSLDNSAYQEFVGKLYEEIIKAALSSGTQGAVIGALAVGGVAGGIGFARGATGSLVLQAVTGIRNRILAALLAVSSGAMNNVVQVMVRDVTNTLFRGIQRQLQAATASLPAVNWPSSRPMTQGVTTVSTKALAPGQQFAELPGSAFASQKRLIGDILNVGLKEALRGAANAFVDAVRNGLNSAVRAVNVKDLGAPMQPALRAGRVAGLLPAGIGREAATYSTGRLGRDGESRAEMLARREREARIRSALRAVDVMGGGAGRVPAPYSQAYRAARPTGAIVPYAAGGALVPSFAGGGGGTGGGGTGGGGGGGRGPGGGFGGGFFGGLSKLSLPGTGTINALGTEFAFATKQVLLFGQAYKLLAFIQDFPGQVSNAVGQLQSFRNTLNSISPSAKEAAISNQFILDIVDRYNIPLQSARDGFAKLYASMAPAGFNGEQIRNLFTGISQAAATFGMSADKVDRVNYAFAQMASKGQVMSEELKGQLGDVLPGAMAIFAEAAGFKGPDAIQKFSKALEDGAYKGQAMTVLLNNVGVVMRKEFGPGAEGAAKTFQGVINRLQNSMKLLYESFEPVAIGFLNSVVVPLTNGIQTITDGFNAFFTGTQAKTAGGMAFAKELERLKPSLEGIGNNLMQLVPTFQLFGNVLLNAAKALAVIAGNPIVGFLLKVYANVLLVNTVFTLLGGKILVGLISSIGSAIARFIALNASVAALQRTSAVASSSLAGTQLQMALLTRGATSAIGPVTMLKTALAGLARFGLIAIAVEVAISGMAEIDRLKKSLDEIAGFSSKEYKRQVQGLSREEVNSRIIVNRRSQRQTQEELKNFAGPLGFVRGLVTGRDEELRARRVVQQTQEAVLAGARGNRTQAQIEQTGAGAMAPIPEGAGDEKKKKKGADKAAKEAEQLREQIAKQAQAAADALFNEQQRLTVMQATDPTAKALAEYASQELVIQRELNKALAAAKSEKEHQDIIDAAAIQQKQNALTLDQELDRAREQAMQPIEDALRNQREQLLVESDIKNLIANGMNPERAKEVAEVRKMTRAAMETIDAQVNAIDNQIKLTKAAILEREAREGSTKAVEKLRDELAALEEERKKAEGERKGTKDKGAQAEAGVPDVKPKTPTEMITDRIAKLKEEIANLTNVGTIAISIADGIGDAFGQAFQGLITGAMTAQQALASFFKSVGEMFVSMAAQIIAKQMALLAIQLLLKALGLFGGGGGGGGGASNNYSGAFGSSGPTFNPGAFSMPKLAANGAYWQGGFQAFADGGVVNGPTLGLVGEGGQPEYIIPASKMSAAMNRYASGARGAAVIPGAADGNGGPTAGLPLDASSIDIRYSVERINSVDYVTADQFQRGMAEAAQQGAAQGEQRTLRRLQQSRSTRSRLGMR